jgi:protein-S-isoprenylcysteine O-methyltransferase Ste14
MSEPQEAAVWFIEGAWIAWACIWAILSAGVKANARQESLVSRLAHLLPLGAAVWLLSAGDDYVGHALAAEVLKRAAWMAPAGVPLVAGGLLFAVWARLTIGTNWSGTVTVKQNHALIRHGPYALARHPIYTGLLAAFLGTAIAIDAWRGVLAFVLVALAFLRKMRTEEAFMIDTFGDEYRDYRQRTAALIPMVW